MKLSVALLLAVLRSSSGNLEYCRISPQHTLCLYQGVSASCGTVLARGVSDREKQLIVSRHNELRSRVATGNENRGRPGPQPAAANMLQMTWDDELAAVAQRWADQCNFGHDASRDVSRFAVGQNVYEAGTFGDEPTNWKRAITSWYDEVEDYSNGNVDVLSFSGGTGHYTQIVWAKTNRIGCGFVNYDNGGRFTKQYMVCNYGPTGNLLGASVYQRGSACSACPAGTKCAAGLCSESFQGSNSSQPATSRPVVFPAATIRPIPTAPVQGNHFPPFRPFPVQLGNRPPITPLPGNSINFVQRPSFQRPTGFLFPRRPNFLGKFSSLFAKLSSKLSAKFSFLTK